MHACQRKQNNLIMDMDESIGADYDYGLQKLKGLLEGDENL